MIEASGIVIEPVTHEQARLARAAYRAFGRGSGHPAGLNFGDCFAYALAKARGEPLLFKGEDFARTDLRGRACDPAGTGNLIPGGLVNASLQIAWQISLDAAMRPNPGCLTMPPRCVELRCVLPRPCQSRR